MSEQDIEVQSHHSNSNHSNLEEQPNPEIDRTTTELDYKDCCEAQGNCCKCLTSWMTTLWALAALAVSIISVGLAIGDYSNNVSLEDSTNSNNNNEDTLSSTDSPSDDDSAFALLSLNLTIAVGGVVSSLKIFYQLKLSTMANYKRYRTTNKNTTSECITTCFKFSFVWGGLIAILALNLIPIAYCIGNFVFISTIIFITILGSAFPLCNCCSDPKDPENANTNNNNIPESRGERLLDFVILTIALFGAIIALAEIFRGIVLGINSSPYSDCKGNDENELLAQDSMLAITKGGLVLTTCIGTIFQINEKIQYGPCLIILLILFIVGGLGSTIIAFIEFESDSRFFAIVWGFVVFILPTWTLTRLMYDICTDQSRQGQRMRESFCDGFCC